MDGLSRRRFLLAGGAALAALSGELTGAAPQRGHRPNLLLLMSDQHRADCVGADGNPLILTPSLDRIAAEGVQEGVEL